MLLSAASAGHPFGRTIQPRPVPGLRIPLCSAKLAIDSQSAGDSITRKGVAGLLAAGLLSLSGNGLAAEKVGDFPASGIVFKDSVKTLALEDPEVQGVTIYISDFEQNLADKFKRGFEEPSSASVTCANTGPIVIKDPKKIRGTSGEDVFSEKKGLGFIKNKTLHVRRIFDESHKALLYIAYSTRLVNDSKDESPGRYRTSVCALPVSSSVTAVEKTDSNVDTGLISTR